MSAYAFVDEIYTDFARDEHAPGLVAGVVDARGLVHLVTHGMANIGAGRSATADTRFRIASMTKSVTALAVLMLRDSGDLRLDDPLRIHVPEFAKVAAPTTDSRDVSLRDLLNHSAGFVTDDPWGDRQLGMSSEEFSRVVRDGGLFAQPPGIAFEYSNLGYALLGRAVTNVTERPYQQFLRESLFAPLGMTSTTFDYYAVPERDRAVGYRWGAKGWTPQRAEPDGEFGAMGGLVTTANDYARYVALLTSAWPARDDPDPGPVRRATIRELGQSHGFPLAARMRDTAGPPEALASAYGYGMVSTTDPTLGRYLHHLGGLPGYGSHVLVSPDTGLGLFVFANRTYAPADRANLAAALALRGAGVWRRRAPEVSAALAAAAARVAAAYEAGEVERADPLAENLLLDTPAIDLDEILRTLKLRHGTGRLKGVEARHALAGRFAIACERGLVRGEVTLAPGPAGAIQTLSFDEAP